MIILTKDGHLYHIYPVLNIGVFANKPHIDQYGNITFSRTVSNLSRFAEFSAGIKDESGLTGANEPTALIIRSRQYCLTNIQYHRLQMNEKGVNAVDRWLLHPAEAIYGEFGSDHLEYINGVLREFNYDVEKALPIIMYNACFVRHHDSDYMDYRVVKYSWNRLSVPEKTTVDEDDVISRLRNHVNQFDFDTPHRVVFILVSEDMNIDYRNVNKHIKKMDKLIKQGY